MIGVVGLTHLNAPCPCGCFSSATGADTAVSVHAGDGAAISRVTGTNQGPEGEQIQHRTDWRIQREALRAKDTVPPIIEGLPP